MTKHVWEILVESHISCNQSLFLNNSTVAEPEMCPRQKPMETALHPAEAVCLWGAWLLRCYTRSGWHTQGSESRGLPHLPFHQNEDV